MRVVGFQIRLLRTSTQHERWGFVCPLTTVLCLLAFVLCPLPLQAVDTLDVVQTDPVLEDWRWTVLDADDGLKGSVRNLVEDRNGNLWVGTTAGVQMYDGVVWTHYTEDDGLVHNSIRALMQASDGSMWFGGPVGISRLSFTAEDEAVWETHTFEDGVGSVGPGTGLAQTRDGTIWAGFIGNRRGDDGAIRRYANGHWSVVEPTVGPKSPSTFGILEASDGVLYFATYDGVLRYDGKDWSLEPATAPIALVEGTDGDIWSATYLNPREVLRYTPSTGSWRHYSADVIGIPLPIMCWADDDGTVWATGGNQLTRFRNGEWSSYPRFDRSMQLGSITVSRRGSRGVVWLWGAFGKSVVRFNQRDEPSYFSHVDSLLVGPEGPDGSVWFSSAEGVVRYKGDVWLRYGDSDGAFGGSVTALTRADDGSIWASGLHRGAGVTARFEGERWTRYTAQDGALDAPRALLITDAGDVWATGEHGERAAVARFDGTSWTRITLPFGIREWRGEVDQRRGVVGGYEASDGTLWFREYGNGVHRFDPEAESTSAWMHFTGADSLISNRSVLDLAEWPEGTLWAGTERGMHHIALDGLPERRVWSHESDFPVNSPKFQSFVTTQEGLWVTPIFNRSRGVFRYDGSSWEQFRAADGLPHDGVRSISTVSDGALWFVGMSGMSRYHPREGWLRMGFSDGFPDFGASYLYQNLTETKGGALWVDVDGKRVMRLRHQPRRAPETFLKPAVESVTSAGNILIRWHGTTPWNETPPEELLFRWRLDQGDWTETEDTDITLTSLSPGPHRFEVYTVAPTTLVDSSPAVHAFVVDAPWYRDPRFAIPISALFLVAIVQTSRVVGRDRRLRLANQALSDANNELFRANRELSEQSERKSAFLASMSHELRTPMNAIKGFTNLVIRRGKDQPWDRSEANLQKVSQASDHLLAQIDDLLDLSKIEAGRMDVTVSEFDIREAIEYCVSTVSPLVQEGVRLSASVDASVGTANTDEQRVRQMVINLLSNAVKFTDAGSVTVGVSIAEQGSGGGESGGKGESKARVQGAGVRETRKASSESRVASAEFRGRGETLVISVSDTGKGIPGDELPTLFDEYRQVAGQSESEVQRGTGLGLSITKRFAELLGGTIEVESEVGRGSTFTVRIPSKYEHS